MRKIGLFVLLLASCRPESLRRTVDCPEGYVPVDTADGEFKGRAMSAGGVVFAIRERPHEPQASLEFWNSVILKELTETKGFSKISSKDLGGGRATLFAAPEQSKTSYYVALFVSATRIMIVEIAGPQSEVEKDLPRLEEFIVRHAPL
jgi:hypothetical protein